METGPTRSKTERENDLVKITDYVLKGFSQTEIVKKLKNKVTQQMISYDIQELKKRWQNSALSNTDLYLNKSIKELELMKKELWIEWEKSKKKKKVNQVKEKDSVIKGTGEEIPVIEREEVNKTETQGANIAYANAIERIITKLLALHGIDLKQVNDNSDPDNDDNEPGTYKYEVQIPDNGRKHDPEKE